MSILRNLNIYLIAPMFENRLSKTPKLSKDNLSSLNWLNSAINYLQNFISHPVMNQKAYFEAVLKIVLDFSIIA